MTQRTIITIGDQKPDPAELIAKTETKKVSTFVVFAKLQDMDQLKNAIHLDNREFYYVDLDEEYKNTEMMIVDIGHEKYQLVVREFNLDGHSYVDNTTDISKEAYVSLRKTASVGFKYKYLEFHSPYSDMIWEVMVFLGKNGLDCPWVRMSICIEDDNKQPRFPFDVSEFVIDSKSSSQEHKNLIADIWTKLYFKFDSRDIANVVK